MILFTCTSPHISHPQFTRYLASNVFQLMLAVILLFSLAACKSDGGADAPEASPSGDGELSAYARVYTDDCGRKVELPDKINAIAASGPLPHIVLFAIAPDMLVGLAMHWADNAKGIIGEEYLDLPYFGQLYGSADLNIEELALTAPSSLWT